MLPEPIPDTPDESAIRARIVADAEGWLLGLNA
jgi:hypothetical protein